MPEQALGGGGGGGDTTKFGNGCEDKLFKFSCINNYLKHGTFGIIQLTSMFWVFFKVHFNFFTGFHNDYLSRSPYSRCY